MRLSILAVFFLAASTVSATQYPISPDLYNKFIRYTKLSAASYASVCADPPGTATVVKKFSNDLTGAQGYLFRDDTNSELILAFRGTSSILDFIIDYLQDLVPFEADGIDCASCTVHEGYLAQWNAISDSVQSVLNTAIASYPSYTLTLTGHSMGGGLASIASASLSGLGYPITAVYTIGQPRTGNQAYADYLDSIWGGQNGVLYRVTHANDGVPQIPSEEDGYRHHHTEYWSQDPVSVGNTVECEGQEPADCNQSEIGYGIGNGGIGINIAHLTYFNLSVGNPLDMGSIACSGAY